MDIIKSVIQLGEKRFYNRLLIYVIIWLPMILYHFWDFIMISNVNELKANTRSLISFILIENLIAFLNFVLFSESLKLSFDKKTLYPFIIAFSITFLAGPIVIHGLLILYAEKYNNPLLLAWLKSYQGIPWYISFLKLKNVFLTYGVYYYLLFIPMIFLLLLESFRHTYKIDELAKNNLQLEINFLRAQIKPHFLFNTLNSLYNMVIDNEKAAELVLTLSDLMRYILYESGQEKIALNEEMKFIQNYIELEKLRIGERVHISMDLEYNSESRIMIPPLILLTFVENAFKHGIHASKNKSWISIEAKETAENFMFIVQNSISTNRKITTLNKGSGIGLKNTKQRLGIYYPNNKYKLEMSSQGDSFIASLLLKL